ncbi:MAG: Trk system potassium transporter TrkA [Planctomycetes bacterium]|nr:Trk system potassium transporter TrkA [Planctomycetota bacterium]
MDIVIGGQDEIAFRLAEGLMVDHAVVLVCPADIEGPRLDRLDVRVVHGEVTSTEALADADVANADFFIAASPYDEQNLVSCIYAKRMGARRTVCFLFRRDLKAWGNDPTEFAQDLGIDEVVRPAEQLAEEILRIVAVPGALDVAALAGGRVRLLRYAVEEDAPITQNRVRDADLPEGVVLLMIRREDQMILPRGDTIIEPGDKVTAIGTVKAINRLLFRYLRRSRRREVRRATVVGGGLVGFAVASGLEDAGWAVKVVEANRERCEELSPLFEDALVLHGDGTDIDLLEQERVTEDSVFVAVTSNDEKNLLISLLAKHLGVPRIVTRADLPANERLFEKVGIDVVRSTRGAAIQSVITGMIRGHSELVAELEHGDAVVLEMVIPEDAKSRSIVELDVPGEGIIGTILRGGKIVIPHGSDVVQAGDRLLVYSLREFEEEVHDFFTRKLARESKS